MECFKLLLLKLISNIKLAHFLLWILILLSNSLIRPELEKLFLMEEQILSLKIDLSFMSIVTIKLLEELFKFSSWIATSAQMMI